MANISEKVERYNKLQALIQEIAYGDLTKILKYQIKEKRVLTLDEAAKVLGTSKQNVHRRVGRINDGNK